MDEALDTTATPVLQFATFDMCSSSSVEICCRFSAIQLSRYLRESAVSLQFLLVFFKEKHSSREMSPSLLRFVTLACANYQNR